MPRTGRQIPAGLSIQLDPFQATYLPGDTLTGWITDSNATLSNQPDHTIRLKLFGRAKSKYNIHRNNKTKTYRGRASFFAIEKTVSQGRKWNPAGGHAYPFTITIPETSQPGKAGRGDEWKPHKYGYLATKDTASHVLPGAMYYSNKSKLGGRLFEAYVEYVLLAATEDRTATLPLFLRQKGTETPIKDYNPLTGTTLQIVRTPKLLAEHANSVLTFSQECSKLFSPSKTPKYTYNVKVEHPRTLQLEHPDPLPLKIAIVPGLNPQQTTICPDGNIRSLPPVNLTSIRIQLKMEIGVRCSAIFSHPERDESHTFEISIPSNLKPFPIPVIPASEIKHVMPAPENLSLFVNPQPRYADPASCTGAILPVDHDTASINDARNRQTTLAPSSVATAASFATDDTVSIDDALSQETTSTPSVATAAASPATDDTASADTASINDDALGRQSSLTPTTSTTTGLPNRLPLNIGARYSIFLGSSASSTLDQAPISFKHQLCPTFTTYNVRVRYQLKWKLGIECAGETKEVSGVAPLTILAASEEQEAMKRRELGESGMKKNYAALEAGLGKAVQFFGPVLKAVP